MKSNCCKSFINADENNVYCTKCGNRCEIIKPNIVERRNNLIIYKYDT